MKNPLIARAMAGEDVDAAEIDRAFIIADAKRRAAEQQAATQAEQDRSALRGVSRIAAALAARQG